MRVHPWWSISVRMLRWIDHRCSAVTVAGAGKGGHVVDKQVEDGPPQFAAQAVRPGYGCIDFNQCQLPSDVTSFLIRR
jgi:hypothetical protein